MGTPEQQTSVFLALERRVNRLEEEENALQSSLSELSKLKERVEVLEAEFQASFSPLNPGAYIKRYLLPEDAQTPCFLLYNCYTRYCQEICRSPVPMNHFISMVNRVYPSAGYLMDGNLYYRLIHK